MRQDGEARKEEGDCKELYTYSCETNICSLMWLQ